MMELRCLCTVVKNDVKLFHNLIFFFEDKFSCLGFFEKFKKKFKKYIYIFFLKKMRDSSFLFKTNNQKQI